MSYIRFTNKEAYNKVLCAFYEAALIVPNDYPGNEYHYDVFETRFHYNITHILESDKLAKEAYILVSNLAPNPIADAYLKLLLTCETCKIRRTTLRVKNALLPHEFYADTYNYTAGTPNPIDDGETDTEDDIDVDLEP